MLFRATLDNLRFSKRSFYDCRIPPSAYAKAKQAPEDERDDVLCKELETLLGKVGCPPNPSQQGTC